MVRNVFSIFIVLFAFSGSRSSDVTLTGSTTDCFADSVVHIAQVNISAFDARESSEMLDSLRAIDALNFTDSAEAATTRMENQYNRVRHLSDSSTALARTTSDDNGSFQLSFAPVDSVLVFGWYDSEDDPFSFNYKVIGGQVGGAVVLDMSHGRCGYLTQ